jgi:hypothetical protein
VGILSVQFGTMYLEWRIGNAEGRKGTCGAGGYLILMYYHEGWEMGEGNAIHVEGMAVLAVVLVRRVWRLECGG